MPFDVFISYSTKDNHVAHALVSALENRNVRCFITPRDIAVGQDWAETINHAVRSAPVMVVIFSKNSNNSSEVAKEIRLAMNHNTAVIPFKIDNTEPSGALEYHLGNTHWLDAINPLTEKQIDTLLNTLSPLIDRAVMPPDRSSSAWGNDATPFSRKSYPQKRNRIIYAAVAALVIIAFAFTAIFKIWPFAEDLTSVDVQQQAKAEPAQAETGSSHALTAQPQPAQAAAEQPLIDEPEPVDALLELDFKEATDIAWLTIYNDGQSSQVELKDGYISIHDGTNVNYPAQPGMLLHTRIRSSACGGVSLGPYRICLCPMNPLTFCTVADTNGDNMDDMSTDTLPLQGRALLNTSQWLDIIIAVSASGDTVYAFVNDPEQENALNYTAYAIPDLLRDQTLHIAFYFWPDPNNADQFFEIDCINVSEGSVLSYLEQSITADKSSHEHIESLLQSSLPTLDLAPSHQ